MINFRTRLFGNNIIAIEIEKLKKNTKLKFFILFYRRSAYYFYIENIRDTHER